MTDERHDFHNEIMKKAIIIIITEGKDQREIELNPGENILFRRQEPKEREEDSGPQLGKNTHWLQSPYISQRHALLRATEDGRVLLKDVHSANGTYLKLPPWQEYELDQNSEALLSQDVSIQIRTGLSESLPEVSRFSSLTDFVKYLQSQLGEYVASIRTVPEDSPELQRPGAVHTRLPLLTSRSYILVTWRGTLHRATERWLQSCTTLFNSGAPRETTVASEVPWAFTAASKERRDILQLARRVAATNSTVLLYGPTGVGKDVLAHDIHRHSQRAKGIYLTVNCAAIPPDIFEGELFGTVRGAFSGAVDRMGLFERANNGTLFLDEIGDLSFDLQAKLLRALDTRRIRRVGESGEERPVNTRVIAATNKDLERMVAEGKFRADLLFRLNAVQLALSPLSPGDVRALVPILVKKLPSDGYPELPVDEVDELVERAALLPWEGNVRDLYNVLQRYAAFRDLEKPFAENWRQVLMMSTSLRPPPGPPSPSSVDTPEAAVQVEITADAMQIGKYIDTLIFLRAARQKLIPKQRGSLAKLGDQLDMTGAGVAARLERLGIDTHDPDPARLDLLIQEHLNLLQPFLPFLRGLLGL